jgi:formylglycine-generating enzyme required for sulfatase activity
VGPDRLGLLRALSAGLPGDAVAELFGFEAVVAPLDPGDPGEDEAEDADPTVDDRWPREAAEVPLWRVVGSVVHGELPQPGPEEVVTAADLKAGRVASLHDPTAPCDDLALLLERLRAAMAEVAPGRAPDLSLVIDRVARGEPVHRVPTLPRPRWPERVALWVDGSVGSVSLRDDQISVMLALMGELGADAVEAWWVHELGAPARAAEGVGCPVVLALADLGGGALLDPGWWAEAGAALAARGVRAVALSSVPVAEAPIALRRHWRLVPLEAAPRAASGATDGEGVQLLAGACALATLVQPGLLRALRLRLARWCTLEDELAVAASLAAAGAMHSADACGLMVAPARAPALRAGLRRALDARIGAAEAQLLLSALWAEIEAWHATFGPELIGGEAVVWGAEGLPVRAAALAQGRALLRRVVGTLQTGHGAGPSRDWLDWADHLCGGRPASDDGLGSGDDDARLLRALQVAADGARANAAPRRPTRWSIRQLGPRLRLTTAPTVEDPALLPELLPGSPVGALLVGATLTITRDGARQAPVAAAGPLDIDLADVKALTIDGGAEVLTLARLSRADDGGWTAMGRDEFGLWADADLNGVVQRFRWVPPGRFLMGSPESEDGRDSDEGPQHEVELTEGYWLGDTPVTQALWAALTGERPSHFKDKPGAPLRPVESVSWHDAQRAIQALNAASGGSGLAYRLPSEAEWERACRAGTQGATWRGDLVYTDATKWKASLLEGIAWVYQNSGRETHAVATKDPNPWGLYDMLGSVLEWCEDSGSFADGYARSERRVNPLVRAGSSPLSRVSRGGTWRDRARLARAAFRGDFGPSSRVALLGLRLSRGRAHPTSPPNSQASAEATPQTRPDGLKAEPSPARRGGGGAGGGR